jgi:proteasome lid subunit RPN8/RPN11
VGERGASGGQRWMDLPLPVRAEVQGWARAAYPREGCGLLLGRASTGASRVVRATLARNGRLEERGDRYEIDPADHLAARKAAEAEGLEVVGAWHSHPDHAPIPSATDLAEAHEGLSYLIVAVTQAGAGELRAWRLAASASERRFVEEALRP